MPKRRVRADRTSLRSDPTNEELNMKVVDANPVLECTLREFFDGFCSEGELLMLDGEEYVTTAFRGESNSRPKFRIPAADTGGDIFFDSQELFCRFASVPTPTQRCVLNAIRRAMAEHNVRDFAIEIPWSKRGYRKLHVRSTGSGKFETLDFDLK